jgi:CRP/FNR family transcriptional regulator, cyclic AMP receptor protein
MLTPFQTRALGALSASPFFGELSPECLRWIYRTPVRKGATLFAKNAPSEHLYGLVSGSIKLFCPGPEGRDLSLGLIAPGELVGELGVSDGAPHHASAVALSHSELASIRRRDLEPLMERHPELRAALVHASAEAARRLSQRLEDAAFLSIEKRVEKMLLDLAQRFGERIERGTRIRLRQQDLADILGLSRESVSRALTSPALRGRLELGRGCIVLVGAPT